jgi:S-layer homology domain
MNFKNLQHRFSLLMTAVSILIAMSVRMHADTGTCNGVSITLPFTDVASSNVFFCSIAEAYFSGLTNGTTATTYSPSDPVPREQMAAFITRTMDQSLKRGSRRAALDRWWTVTDPGAVRAVSLNATAIPHAIVCDGLDLWISDEDARVFRVRASDGTLLGTWTGATGARGLIAAAGRIFIAGDLGSTTPGKIYVINPDLAPGAVTVFENDIGAQPYEITFDGANLWTANPQSGSISRVNVGTVVDSTFTGFTDPVNILWDGTSLWVNDFGQLKRVDPTNATVLESIPVTGGNMRFDGANIWLSNADIHANSITIVRATGALRGTILATLTGNGMFRPYGMAFDGERMLVGNLDNSNSVSLFNATSFAPLGNVFLGANAEPRAACSDGVNFWVCRYFKHDIVRF